MLPPHLNESIAFELAENFTRRLSLRKPYARNPNVSSLESTAGRERKYNRKAAPVILFRSSMDGARSARSNFLGELKL